MKWVWWCSHCGQRSGGFKNFNKMIKSEMRHIKIYCSNRFRTMPVEHLNGPTKKAMKHCDLSTAKLRKRSKIRKALKYRSWKHER